jgi:hypothetical protein
VSIKHIHQSAAEMQNIKMQVTANINDEDWKTAVLHAKKKNRR